MRFFSVSGALSAIVFLVAAAGGVVFAKPIGAEKARRALMGDVQTWGYQLQKLDTAALAASPFDLLVVDHAPDRVESVELSFRPKEVAALKVKPDGTRRIVLAYMSIGEAEWYRFYWDPAWSQKANCPAWLGPVNPQWAGNYPVRYWMPEWQGLIFGRHESYVDRVLAAGFDGVYLDRADVYDQFKDRPTAREDMIAFISKLTDHARSINPLAMVVLQNAEELLSDKDLRVKLDAAAKESLYFNADKSGEPVADDERMAAAKELRGFKKAGGKVLVVEYVDAAYKAAEARQLAAKDGFAIHFTERSLSVLSLKGPDELPSLASFGGRPAAPSGPQTDSSAPASPCG